MGAFVGPLGFLVEVAKYQTGASISSESRYPDEVTLGGKKVVQVSRGRHRTWEIPIASAYSSELSPLISMTSGAFGDGPFWFIDVTAQHTNILPLRLSMVREAGWIEAYTGRLSLGGPMIANDGAVVGSPVANNVKSSFIPLITVANRVPVVAGRPVTVSAYGTVGAYISGTFFDANGSVVDGSSFVTSPVEVNGLERMHASLVAPDSAAAVSFNVYGASLAGGPAVTWTKGLMPYTPGFGASKVVVEQSPIVPKLIVEGSQIFETGFTVKEVGVA